MPGVGTSPASEAVLTMWPKPCAAISGQAAAVPLITPPRLTATTRCQSVTGTPMSAPAGPPMPALLNTRSSRP